MKQRKRLIELAVEHNLLVISDEVYRDLCFETPPTSASVLADGSGATVAVLESLSKTHMLSGWRVGWMRLTPADRARELMDAVIRLAGGRLCSPTTAQYAIQPALLVIEIQSTRSRQRSEDAVIWRRAGSRVLRD